VVIHHVFFKLINWDYFWKQHTVYKWDSHSSAEQLTMVNSLLTAWLPSHISSLQAASST